MRPVPHSPVPPLAHRQSWAGYSLGSGGNTEGTHQFPTPAFPPGFERHITRSAITSPGNLSKRIVPASPPDFGQKTELSQTPGYNAGNRFLRRSVTDSVVVREAEQWSNPSQADTLMQEVATDMEPMQILPDFATDMNDLDDILASFHHS